MPFSSGQDGLLQINEQQFDFNVQFEQVFFAIIPSVLFIASSAWRSFTLLRRPTIVHAPTFQLLKLCTITAYVGLQLGLLILVAIGSFHATSVFITAAILNLVSALFMISLSLLDHNKSARPSVLLNSYLFLTLILDVVQARTFFLSSDGQAEFAYSSVFVATVALKCLILLLEAQRKSKWIGWNEKEHSPEESSGIFSLGVFFWLNRIFIDGYRKILSPDDLYSLDSALKGSGLHEAFSRRINYNKLASEKYGLLKVLMSTLKVPILLPIPPRLALLGFTFCQPLFIQKLVEYLSDSEKSANVGFGFIGASALIYAGMAISTSLYWYFHFRSLAMSRSILVTEIYRKATRSRIGTTDDGAALSMMSTDVERIRMGFLSVHDIWASVIQVGVAAYLLYRQVGFIFVAPIIVVILCFVGLAIVMRYNGNSQKTWMAAIQKRVGLTATVISSMKNLKISGLAGAVGDLVQQLRVEDLAAGTRFRQFIVIAALFGFLPMMLAPPLTFAFAQHTLSPATMFTSLSYLSLLTTPLTQIFQSIPSVGAAIACLDRIQTFLVAEDRQDFRQISSDLRRAPEKPSFIENATNNTGDPLVLAKAGFGWQPDKFVLSDISTRITRSSLNMIIGPVGSGKSTLCKALLGEIPYSRGSVYMETRLAHVGFCDQTPFLSNGSVKDNIVGFSEYDAARYDSVIHATALNFDLETLPRGDSTNIGSDGITLSGGQKQRVSLARALYLHTDLVILDDVFSGLDADTEELVFQRVFGRNGLLRQRKSTVVLCTHSIRHLPAADHILVLDNGTVTQQGSFTSLMKCEGYVQKLGLEPSSDEKPSSKHTDSNQDAKKPSSGVGPSVSVVPIASDSPDASPSRMHGDRTVYKHYFRSMGQFLAASCLVTAAMWGFFTNFPTIWLKYWSEDVESAHPSHSFAYYAGLYALMQILAIVSLLLIAIAIFIVSVKRAGASLHRDALRTLIRAPLSFLTSTDTGVITNLFSQDLNLIDTELSSSLLNVLISVASALGQAAVMLTASAYMAISYPFLAIIVFVLQKFYLRTSRQLRLLDLEAKSPLYTHFLDTVKGISTLRALGFIGEDVDKNARLIDSSQRPAYLLSMTQEWLSLVLNLIVMIMAVVLTTLAVRMHSNAGFAGASLVTLMSFGENLAGIVTSYTRLETSIGAISRLRTFNETVQPENKDDEDIYPSEDWPQNGTVELTGVSASYRENTKASDEIDLALKNLHLTITSGEKVAICGRTGSGKSSLIALLLKLLDPTAETSDHVVIDGTRLQYVDRPTLRQRILAIPQEAVFLPDGSSFQANLDPLNTSTFEDCSSVLAAIGMWQFVHERGGLSAGMSSSTLSAGQRQLMSLGRTLLRRRARSRKLGNPHERGLLLLDEVSSNVDHATERVMQDIIRTEFRDYTVIAVSHRLDMIMDFDRVVVMDRGSIVEVGNPAKLAQDGASRFGELVRASAA